MRLRTTDEGPALLSRLSSAHAVLRPTPRAKACWAVVRYPAAIKALRISASFEACFAFASNCKSASGLRPALGVAGNNVCSSSDGKRAKFPPPRENVLTLYASTYATVSHVMIRRAFTTASRQGEKTTASHDQARQSRSCNRTWYGQRRD